MYSHIQCHILPILASKRVFVLILSLMPTLLFSQSGRLFTDTTLTDYQLSSPQLSLKELYSSYPNVESLQFIKIGNLPGIQHDGLLDLKIPGDTTTYSFSAKQVNSFSNGDYSWIGTLISPRPCVDDSTDYLENDCTDGSIMLMKIDTSIFGEMHIEDNAYQIKDLGGGLNTWIKLQRDTFSGCLSTDAESPRDSTEADLESMCPVRLLALYTSAALSSHPDIKSIINMSVANMNFILTQSHISDHLLKIVLVGPVALTTSEFTELGGAPPRILTDARSLAGNTAVTKYREDYNADLVVVFTGDVYTGPTGVVAAFGDNASKCDSGYAIVESGYATYPYLTFSHEVAHLFGARHEGTNVCFSFGDNSGLPYSHGWIITKKFLGTVQSQYKTTVAVCPGSTRIEYYSNPNVEYKSKPTGGTNNYNAKTIAEAACRISHCINSEGPNVSLIAPDFLCQNEEAVIQGVVSGVSGTILYYWQTSSDGLTYTPSPPTASSSSNFTITAPSVLGQKIWVRLTAGNSGGPFVTANKMITVSYAGCGRPAISNVKNDNIYPIVNISPNPASDELRIKFNNTENSTFEIVIFDSLGKMVKKIEKYNNALATEAAPIQISNLPNGIYWLSIKSKNYAKTIQFACLR